MEAREEIITLIQKHPELSSGEIYESIASTSSYATVKRMLTRLVSENLLVTKGRGKGTRYLISPAYALLAPVNIDQYYEKEIDERV